MQMKIQIEEAGDRFNELLELVLNGKEVLLMDNQKAVARLVRVESDPADEGKDKWTSDDFDIKLSKDK